MASAASSSSSSSSSKSKTNTTTQSTSSTTQSTVKANTTQSTNTTQSKTQSSSPSEFTLIPANCPPFDSLFDGGLYSTYMYEFKGRSGIGKTHLFHHLVTEAIILQYKVLFVDCEASYSPAKIRLMLRARGAVTKECIDGLLNHVTTVDVLPSIGNLKRVLEHFKNPLNTFNGVKTHDMRLLVIDNIHRIMTPALAQAKHTLSQPHLYDEAVERLCKELLCTFAAIRKAHPRLVIVVGNVEKRFLTGHWDVICDRQCIITEPRNLDVFDINIRTLTRTYVEHEEKNNECTVRFTGYGIQMY